MPVFHFDQRICLCSPVGLLLVRDIRNESELILRLAESLLQTFELRVRRSPICAEPFVDLTFCVQICENAGGGEYDEN